MSTCDDYSNGWSFWIAVIARVRLPVKSREGTSRLSRFTDVRSRFARSQARARTVSLAGWVDVSSISSEHGECRENKNKKTKKKRWKSETTRCAQLVCVFQTDWIIHLQNRKVRRKRSVCSDRPAVTCRFKPYPLSHRENIRSNTVKFFSRHTVSSQPLQIHHTTPNIDINSVYFFSVYIVSAVALVYQPKNITENFFPILLNNQLLISSPSSLKIFLTPGDHNVERTCTSAFLLFFLLLSLFSPSPDFVESFAAAVSDITESHKFPKWLG